MGTSTSHNTAVHAGHTDLSPPSVTASRSLARARASTSISPSNTCSTVAASAHATEAQLMAHTNGCTRSHSLVVASHTTPPTLTWPAPPIPSKASVAVLIGHARQKTLPGLAPPSLLPASVEPSTSTPTPPSPSMDPSPVLMPWRRKSWPADLSHAALMLALSSSTPAELHLWLETASITSSASSDGALKAARSTGSFATPGENTGERWDTCASRRATTLCALRSSAHGL